MPQDVITAAPLVIKHRLICKGSGISKTSDAAADEVLRQILDSVSVPTEDPDGEVRQ